MSLKHIYHIICFSFKREINNEKYWNIDYILKLSCDILLSVLYLLLDMIYTSFIIVLIFSNLGDSTINNEFYLFIYDLSYIQPIKSLIS